MISLIVLHATSNEMYTSKICDMETGNVLAEYNPDTRKIDFSVLEDHIGEVLDISHVYEQPDGGLTLKPNENEKVVLEGIGCENGIKYIAYSPIDKEGEA